MTIHRVQLHHAQKIIHFVNRFLGEDVRLWLDTEVARGRLTGLETVEKDHGRIEIRRHALSDRIDGLATQSDWAGLQAIGRVESR